MAFVPDGVYSLLSIVYIQNSNTYISKVQYIVTNMRRLLGISCVTQVLEHGLFIGVTSALLVACKDGVRQVGGPGGEQPWW